MFAEIIRLIARSKKGVDKGVAVRLNVFVRRLMLSIAVGTAACAATLGMAVIGPLSKAAADTEVGVVLALDGQEITLAPTENGGISGKVSVTNITGTPYTISASGIGEISSCEFTVDPAIIEGARTRSIALASETCTLPDNGAAATLAFDGTPDQEFNVTLVAKTATIADIRAIVGVFLIALVLAGISMAIVWARRPERTKNQEKDDGIRPLTDRLTWGDELEGLGSAWTLDSWASNVTVVGTAFVALFGSTDVLTSVIGEEPKEAVAYIVISGAIAVFFVAAAPMVMKFVGRSETPTLGGVLLGGLLTITGTAGQIGNVVVAVRRFVSDDLLALFGTVVAVLALVGVFAYGTRTLVFRLRRSAETATVTPSDDLRIAAAIMLAAGRSDLGPEAVNEAAKALARPTEETPYPTYAEMRRFSALRPSAGDSAVL